jgi:iron complex transport system ATP-binding protein
VRQRRERAARREGGGDGAPPHDQEGSMSAIEVRDLTVTLGDTPILRGVDLSVEAGEWVTIIGPNGAGKSTLLRAIGGWVPYGGSIALLGRSEYSRRARARVIAAVAQTPIVPAGLSVAEYALLGRTPYIPPLGRESRADLAAVDEVLTRLGLMTLRTRRLETLSGGERQRAFLARALAQEAPLLLLDEPTSALDIGHQQDVLELVDELRRDRSLTVLATMHDLTVAGEYADRLVLISEGRVVAAGRPVEVLTEELIAKQYKANVRIVAGEHGPIVVPQRPKP